MKLRPIFVCAAILLAVVFLQGCNGGSGGNPVDPLGSSAALSSGAGGHDHGGGGGDEEFDPGEFGGPIDNPFLPFTPGTVFEYRADTDEGVEHTETTVTSDKKTILGVETTVVHDVVYLNRELKEDTYDWYAQDDDGNVWYFGEDTKEYENGQVISTFGSWEAGVDGAKQGIIMEAHPHVGDAYQQEYYAGVAEDSARVISLNETVHVPYGTFRRCLKTRETTPLEPGTGDSKYYARGLGFVLAISKPDNVRMELVSVTNP